MSASAANERAPHPHYEIVEECGHGGMGVVYKALDKRLNRTVALKFLRDSGSDSAEMVKRFRREAESIAALNHPNIATLYEVGDWDGEPFLAMEFLPGGSLAARRRPGGVDAAELQRYAHQLGDGLHFAHTRGILHRDVKPANGMFSEHGTLKLVDFGLAKPSDSEDLTHSGASVGTLAYMAPELIRGEEATVRSDIYALGVTLYELAAGHSMFSAKNLMTLVDQVLKAPRVPLNSVRTDLPAPLADAINRAVSPNPEDRFASVSELLEQIGSPVDSVASTRSMTVPRHKPYASGRKKLYWSVGGLFLMAAALTLGYFRSHPGPRPAQVMVVLPFENLGGDPANQALCDGLQETVTGLLSMVATAHNLLVVPSSELRREHVRTIAEARRQFKADLALTGSAQKTADYLRLNLNLDDAASMGQRDTRMIPVKASETADLQDKLAEALGSLLGFGPLPRTSERPRGETTASSAAYSLYLLGVGEVETRRPDSAIGNLQKALHEDPHFALARAKLAEAYFWKSLLTSDPKWLALADAEVNRAAEAGAGREALMAQAMIEKATGHFQSAIRLFGKILENEPGNVEAYQLLAQTLASAGHPVEAETTLRKAIALRPGYWPLENALGNFYVDRGDFRNAEQEFTKAAALAPNSELIFSNLGALYFNMNRLPEAEANFKKSLSNGPSALAHANLCAIYFYQGNYEEAAAHALASTQMQPANPVNWGNLGDARWQIPAQKEAAREAFDHAVQLAGAQLAINPANVRLRKSYALYLAKLGRTREAITQIGMALKQVPGDRYVQFYAARVFAVAGETDRALAALSRCKSLGYSEDELDREPDLAALTKR
ncbi:MAG: protein kinase, partial [Terriglobia bacterium]